MSDKIIDDAAEQREDYVALFFGFEAGQQAPD